jgi:hypothetical protein
LQGAIADTVEPAFQKKMEQAIEQGTPLKQGNRVYGVYQLAIGYDDGCELQ